MASVRVAGRFPAGAVVALVKVDGPWVLRAGAGIKVARSRVEEDGSVQFDALEDPVGSRYFVVGQAAGQPVEVRAVSVDDPDATAQVPHSRDPTVLADGTEVVENDLLVEDEEVPFLESAGDSAGEDKPKAKRRRAGGGKKKAKAPAAPKDDEKPLAGQALKDRAVELEIEGRGSLSADELRAAVAAKEAEAA